MDRKRFTLDDLRRMNSALVPNSWVADIVGMSPDRLTEYARTGKLPWTTLISGNRVKHVRKSLLEFLGG